MSGFAPLGRLISLTMICAGLGTSAVLATAETAQAAGPNSPTAIGVTSDGTSYVGFASGGKLQHLTANGARKKPVPLDQDEAVDGLFVSANDDIWVDYETSVSLLTPHGKVVNHFDHDPVRSCDASAPAWRYGGIAASGNRVYVANRCHASISVYSRAGSLVATVDLPGSTYPRGIAYGVAQAGRPATVYVALPDRGQILAYKASTLRDSSSPTKSYTLDRPYGGSKPEPAGLAVDRFGQLVATDVANNALYFLDTNNDFSLYRTLGHPPRASRAEGRLNSASAIAQHGQDGSGLAGNLFIADTNNDRVQRWSTGGYTYWTKGVQAGAGGGGGGGAGGGGGGDGGDGNDDGNGNGDGDGDGDGGGGSTTAPTNTVAPEITGEPDVGNQLSCYAGAWSGSPDTYERSWLRDGGVISGATGTYTPVEFDRGKQITCRVRAANDAGVSDWAVSDPVTIPGGAGGGDDDGSGGDAGNGPANASPPTVTGTAAVGQVLTCNPGSWYGTGGPTSGAIGYTYAWKRGPAPISGATGATYTVVSADSGQALTCVVRATDTKGSTTATSAAVTVTGSGSGSGPGPVNTAIPAIAGTAAVGQSLTCTPGVWSGTAPITFSYDWKRNGSVVGGAAASTYTVVSEDVGDTLTCTVSATNAAGTISATSAGLTVSGGSGHSPANTVDPTITGTAAVGQAVTCNPGTWTGVPTITYLYAWQRAGAPIDGATAATYTPVASDLGTSLTCLVIAVNGYGVGAETTASVVVAAAPCPGLGVGVSINAGLPSVVGASVTLAIRPPTGAVTMTISNDGGFAGDSTTTVPVACALSWTLSPGLGTRFVYVRFDSSTAAPYFDDIDVVAAPPPVAPDRFW